ncbi:hypothetical protein EVAR_48801_1 [Eumeta japonica]|uniref:Uncharacterized protein n=1 Tax=Eumeta variegata TaxID=151549 RepID=A0A4C1Y391_EUMVA|nr:hypothetical protein EVAR_48801_1 [Eumeta japonica]
MIRERTYTPNFPSSWRKESRMKFQKVGLVKESCINPWKYLFHLKVKGGSTLGRCPEVIDAVAQALPVLCRVKPLTTRNLRFSHCPFVNVLDSDASNDHVFSSPTGRVLDASLFITRITF